MSPPPTERERALEAELERLRGLLWRAGVTAEVDPSRPDEAPAPSEEGGRTRAQLLAELKEREEQLRLAQEVGGIGVFSVELATNLIHMSPEFSRIYGVPDMGTLPAARLEARALPEDQHLISNAQRRAQGLVQPDVEYRIRHGLTGEVRWISRRAELIRDAQGRPVRMLGIAQDVTARKQAERALNEANERLQLALDTGAVIGTWVWDIPADRLTGDARFARSFSIEPERAARGLPLSLFVANLHPDDRPRIEALLARTLETGGAYRAEYRVRQLDGTYKWLEASGHCILAPDGTPLRFPGVLVDIDERKRAELRQSALVELGDRLRDLGTTADIAGTAMGIVGRLFNTLRAGYGRVDASHELLTIEQDWVSHPGIIHLVGLHRFSDYGDFIEELKRGEMVIIPDIERDPRTLAGADNLRVLGIRSLLIVPLLEHGRLCALLFLDDAAERHWAPDELEFIRDVADRVWAASARVETLAQLRKANEQLEQRVVRSTRERDRLWNISQDLMLMEDLEGRFLSVNPAWTTLLGWSEQELVGRTPAWIVHPDDQAKTRAEVLSLASGQRTLRFENSLRHRDGSWRHLSWTAVPLLDEGVIYAFGRDITGQRQTEEQLRQAQKMEAVGQLTGGVAHDFNNLLQVIGGNLQMLQRDVTGSERAQARLRTAVGAVDRGARLAAQLLAFARRQPLEPLVFNLGRLVLGMDELLRRALGENIDIQTRVASDLWNTWADPNQLENVILNLAINARDAMEGHGRLSIEVGNAVLEEHALPAHAEAAPGRYVQLSVSDTGSGMTPEVAARVFEPFFTTKPEGRGTGLGLSMVYGFVKQTGGHIQLHSVVGVGTTFKIYLPRATQAETAPTAAPPEGPVVGGTETLLVVEDDEGVRATVVEMLGELGYRVLKATDGRGALAILQSGLSVDLLFTDVVMPGPVRSSELAQKARELVPDLEVLFTSGYTEDAILHGRRLDPGVHLLSKPHRREDLARKVRHLLDQRRRSAPPQDAPAPPPPPAHVPAPARALRVLLVEDDEDIRSSAHELLELLGHEVRAVASAEEARGALTTQGYDVLFTDVTLPGMSGTELAREAVRRWPGLKTILASGHGSAVWREGEAPWTGVVVLPKPYALPQIKLALEQAVAAR